MGTKELVHAPFQNKYTASAGSNLFGDMLPLRCNVISPQLHTMQQQAADVQKGTDTCKRHHGLPGQSQVPKQMASSQLHILHSSSIYLLRNSGLK